MENRKGHFLGKSRPMGLQRSNTRVVGGTECGKTRCPRFFNCLLLNEIKRPNLCERKVTIHGAVLF